MRLRDHARLLSITLSAIALAATATLPAAASDKPIPGERTIDSAPEEKTQGVPASVYDSLESVQRKIDQLPEFNHYEWDEDSSQLVVHHHGKAERLSTTLTSALPAGAFSLVEDRYSVKELQKESDRIVAAGVDRITLLDVGLTSLAAIPITDRVAPILAPSMASGPDLPVCVYASAAGVCHFHHWFVRTYKGR